MNFKCDICQVCPMYSFLADEVLNCKDHYYWRVLQNYYISWESLQFVCVCACVRVCEHMYNDRHLWHAEKKFKLDWRGIAKQGIAANDLSMIHNMSTIWMNVISHIRPASQVSGKAKTLVITVRIVSPSFSYVPCLSAPLTSTLLHHFPWLWPWLFHSILSCSRLCPSIAGSSHPPESSNFLCPLLSLFIPLPVAPQCHLSNNVLVFPTDLTPFRVPLSASSSSSSSWCSQSTWSRPLGRWMTSSSRAPACSRRVWSSGKCWQATHLLLWLRKGGIFVEHAPRSALLDHRGKLARVPASVYGAYDCSVCYDRCEASPEWPVASGTAGGSHPSVILAL